MSSSEEVDDFASYFPAAEAVDRKEKREVRAAKERKSQLTEKQRKRRGERTAQINFRCAPAFLKDIARAQAHWQAAGEKKPSQADILEDALEMYMAKHGIEAEPRP